MEVERTSMEDVSICTTIIIVYFSHNTTIALVPPVETFEVPPKRSALSRLFSMGWAYIRVNKRQSAERFGGMLKVSTG